MVKGHHLLTFQDDLIHQPYMDAIRDLKAISWLYDLPTKKVDVSLWKCIIVRDTYFIPTSYAHQFFFLISPNTMHVRDT